MSDKGWSPPGSPSLRLYLFFGRRSTACPGRFSVRRRGKTLAAIGNGSQALKDFDRAKTLAPYLAEVYLARGHLFLQQSDLKNAEVEYAAALRLEPRSAEALNGRGSVFARNNRFAQAHADFAAAAEANPGSVNAWVNLGTLYGASGDYAKAVAACSRALDMDPACAPALASRAIGFFSLGDLQRAKEDAEKARALGASLPPDFLKDLKTASAGMR
ncbi:MAG: tetratricopeptide repeat protein [Endomicrobiales bacterium]